MAKIIPVPIPSIPAESRDVFDLFAPGSPSAIDAVRANMELVDFDATISQSIKFAYKIPQGGGTKDLSIRCNFFDDSGGAGAGPSVWQCKVWVNGLLAAVQPVNQTVAHDNAGGLAKAAFTLLASQFAEDDSIVCEIIRLTADVGDTYAGKAGLHIIACSEQL